jgi:hypothetical protein
MTAGLAAFPATGRHLDHAEPDGLGHFRDPLRYEPVRAGAAQLIGYSDQPSMLQVVAYCATLAVIVVLTKTVGSRRAP